MVVPGFSLCMDFYKHKPAAASPGCTHTEDTFISKVGTMKRTGREAHTHFIQKVFFFFPAITAVLKAEENTIFVFSVWRSDKPDSVLT